jgi:DNA-binding transcriptional LysR family regulator
MRYAQLLEYIDQVARAGSIRRAAANLAITSSALNRQILDLEKEIGAVLFERLPHGVRLTTAGEILVAHARRTLSDLDHTKSILDDLRGLRQGSVRIAAIQALASTVLPRVIAAVLADHPRMEFKVDILDRDEVVRSVTNYIVDIGIVFNPKRDSMFQHLMEVEQALFVTVAKGHPLAQRSGVRLHECVEYPLALASQSLGARTVFDEFLHEIPTLRINPAIETNSFELMREFVRISNGVCFQISMGVDRRLSADELISIPVIDHGPQRRKLVVGIVAGRTLPVAAAMFCERLVEALKGSEEADTPFQRASVVPT